MKCRLLETGCGSAAYNMGLDESVLAHVSAGKSPTTLRFYRWKPNAVSIGYFQNIDSEVDTKLCSERGVDVVRRITGGGAVYHDLELTYSYITKQENLPEDILSSYRLICMGLIEGLKSLGIEASFAPLNDVVSGGKKISGNAQTRRMGCVLQHGTLLLGLDLKTMFSLLKIPNEKIREKMIVAASERVTSVSDILGEEKDYNSVIGAFRQGFQRALSLEYLESPLSEGEVEAAKKLSEEKYGSKSWNYKR
jgi:lipoate---protein ligase